ncbi:MAG TPA: hypothetical protein VKV24_03545 [Casimicrobiaceae bacterium]|nr:hypothetical protein [Casimicrobiaceae bacterium]
MSAFTGFAQPLQALLARTVVRQSQQEVRDPERFVVGQPVRREQRFGTDKQVRDLCPRNGRLERDGDLIAVERHEPDVMTFGRHATTRIVDDTHESAASTRSRASARASATDIPIERSPT